MKRTLVSVVVLLLVVARSASAQGAIANAGSLRQWVDIATPEYVAGWAFDKRTGAQPNHLDVLDLVFDPATCPGVACAAKTEWLDVNLWTGLERADVQAVLSPVVPTLTRYAGYWFSFKKPLTTGRHYIAVFWNENLTNSSQSYTVIIDVPEIVLTARTR
jgi:hypothetical protein